MHQAETFGATVSDIAAIVHFRFVHILPTPKEMLNPQSVVDSPSLPVIQYH